MASLKDLLRGKPAGPSSVAAGAGWAAPLFKAGLSPLIESPEGVLVWTVADKGSTATITDQFKANAEEYHRRYAASDHFEALFRQALDATGLKVAERPLILDVGSGSGVNSVVPCRRLFPGARIVATDLSGELLAMLATYARDNAAAEAIVCVKMDAMSQKVVPESFDLVTGASILHHLDSPSDGLLAAGRALKPGGHAIFFEPFNGWAIVRLAFERILAEAQLRGEALEPELETGLRLLIDDVAERSPETYSPALAAKDDKWLFSRARIELSARAAGFETVRFVPHNDHASLYRDVAAAYLRLAVGHDGLRFPGWAAAILDSFDAAMTLSAKRELMVEGSIVLSKGA
jgi:SAM-dependent methyltransferase